MRPAIVTAFLLAALGCAGETPRVATSRDGQWVWSRADADLFAASRESRPGLTPGVWVATIQPARSGDSLGQTLALSPRSVRGPIAAVIRLEPAVARWWTGRSERAVAEQLGRRLTSLLALLDQGGVALAEVQLDFDCPVRLLPDWAGVLHRLRGTALAGREVWITSLVAHQRDPRFGRRMRGAVDGQIIQLFDTGERAGPAAMAELAQLVPAQGLPFRIGLGAFERRVRNTRSTDHAAWFNAQRTFATWPLYRGTWVFPAGFSYTTMLASRK